MTDSKVFIFECIDNNISLGSNLGGQTTFMAEDILDFKCLQGDSIVHILASMLCMSLQD